MNQKHAILVKCHGQTFLCHASTAVFAPHMASNGCMNAFYTHLEPVDAIEEQGWRGERVKEGKSVAIPPRS